jgi:pantoate--beta-alanine ligase
MLLFKKVNDLKAFMAGQKKKGRTTGFVPTMGALHEGHISLVQRSMKETDCTVCSIFVNPTQFNDPADLIKYPRTPEKDLTMLLPTGCHVLFMPEVEEIYPDGQGAISQFDFSQLDKTMEGAHRPGHFAGVAQVVKRLLDIVEPQRLYMGQKDFQQISIVREMLRQLHSETELVMCPIIREPDGLAMSSRNVRLSPEQRVISPLIYQTLREIKAKKDALPPQQLVAYALLKLSVPGMIPEYFEIVDGRTLQPVEHVEDSDFVVACTVVRVGEVRLLDNMILKGAEVS